MPRLNVHTHPKTPAQLSPLSRQPTPRHVTNQRVGRNHLRLEGTTE